MPKQVSLNEAGSPSLYLGRGSSRAQIIMLMSLVAWLVAFVFYRKGLAEGF